MGINVKRRAQAVVMAIVLASMLAGCVVVQDARYKSPSLVGSEGPRVGTSDGWFWSQGSGWRTWCSPEHDYGEDVVVAADGSIYLAGYTTIFSAGPTDAFLAKYNSVGTQLWNRTWGWEASNDRGYGVAMAADGSVYLAGYTNNFGVIYNDAFLVKFNFAGTQLWNRTWGGGNNAYGSDVAVAADGSVYLAGYTFVNGIDAFLAKYNSAGTQLWNCSWGGVGLDYGSDVAVAADGSVYLTGSRTDNAFLTKFNAAGMQLWNQTWNRTITSWMEGRSVAVAADGSVYMAYNTCSTPFFAKFNAAGTQLWNRTWGGDYFTDGYAVSVTANGSVYMAGVKENIATGSFDAFLAKYNSTGTQIWNRTWTRGYDYYNCGKGVAVAADGSVYLIGDTSNSGTTGYDAFIVAYDMSGNPLWPEIPMIPIPEPVPGYPVVETLLAGGAGLVLAVVVQSRRRLRLES